MSKKKRDLSKIVHLDKTIHGKLKMFVTKKQVQGEQTSIAIEAEKAILNHISNSAA
ncbi:MAG: hypothetical protein QY331_07500 [Melioribacteraceae bacterium]|nr:MAG: hypothetical protein QY331_07500 [Melioribacteraceae bacterium]